MKAFPLFVELDGQPVVLVGGGQAAVAKARLLISAGARLTVVAEELADDFYAWAHEGLVRIKRRAVQELDIETSRLVVSASEDNATDQWVSAVSRRIKVPVNVVDKPTLSSFSVPAILERGPITLGISSGGTAPVLAQRLRAELEAILPRSLAELSLFVERHQKEARIAFPDARARRAFWDDVLDGPIAEAVKEGAFDQAERLIAERLAEPAAATPQGQVALVGAGPGDPQLLTLKALQLLQRADVIVHDKLVTDEVLDLARREAHRIYVGKAPGKPSKTQDEINALLVELAQGGDRVVRLKGGDPFIFGRGGEELAALREAGIPVEIVPGITAAAACAASAGFPLTQRGLASSVTFVSGQAAESGTLPDLDWGRLASGDHTLAIYMGVASAERIARRLQEEGRGQDTPVKIIENGTRPEERILGATLGSLAAVVEAERVRPPALIVIGEVAALADVKEGEARKTAGAAEPLALAAE